jgi:ethanolamine utilization protein EutN
MNLATVIGTATSTVKHPSLSGWRLAVAQPLTRDGSDDGDPLLVIDGLQCPVGSRVIITSDGAAIRDMVGASNSPVRWAVIAQPDENSNHNHVTK